MRSLLIGVLATLVGVGACSSSSDDPKWVANFNPPDAPDGYTRFVTPTVAGIAPGADQEECQWLTGPAAEDQDVLDMKGYQSATGHHTVLFATTETNFKVGETHTCTTDDMLSVSFVGAIGGEGNGNSASKLPDGLFFRLDKGKALMANTHWLNATDNTVDGQAALDVEFTAADPGRVIADDLAINGDTFTIPSGSHTTYDTSCVLNADMNLAMVADHMHGAGETAYSELLHPDGTSTMLVTDNSWTSDEQFNPIYTRFSLAQPLIAHAGDTYHTHCEWQNTGSKLLQFPDEMCVGVAFYFPGKGQISCSDGSYDNAPGGTF